MPSSTDFIGGTAAATTTTSFVRSSSRQQQRLNLPPWMTVHHLPEYGIGGSTRNNTTGEKATKEISISTSSRKRPYQSLSSASSRSSGVSSKSSVKIMTTTNNSDNDAIVANEQFAANRLKKDMAIDTLFPPTINEVKCSARSMSVNGLRLVMKEIDDCVKYSLKYSSLHCSSNNNNNNSRKRKRSNSSDSLLNNNRRSDKVVEEVDGKNLMTLAEVMHEYFYKFQPDNDDNDDNVNDEHESSPPTPISRSHTDKVNHRRDALHNLLFPISATTKYDPSILPVICVKCYPNVFDRLEITSGLVSDLSSRSTKKTRKESNKVVTLQHQKQPCVCIVRSTSVLVRQGHAIAELLSQCITNDTQHGEEFASKLQRQRKRMKNVNSASNNGILVKSCWSYIRSFVDWASTTVMFDSIIVILDDVEKISSPTMDAFFVTLSLLRSDYGVPICVVIIDTTPGGLNNRLSCLRDPAIRGSSSSSSGVIIHEVHVPLPQVQLELFINRLFASNCLPSILRTDHRLLKHIYEVFQDCDNSIVSVAMRIKLELRRYFATPCAFLSLLNCRAFTVMNEYRMKYTFGNEYSRKYLDSYLTLFTPVTMTVTAVTTTNMKNSSSHILDLFDRIYISYLSQQIYQRIQSIFKLSPLTDIMVRVSTTTTSVHGMRDLLCLLGNVRHKITTWKYIPPSSHRSQNFCNKLNEWIILAGKLASDDAVSSSISMARALVDNVLAWTRANFASDMKLDVSLTAQPRRDVAKAICTLMPEALTPCSLGHATRCAFGVFQSRLLSLTEWYELYSDVMNDQDGQNKIETFLFAVYELVHLGFVRKIVTGKRGGEAYEKTAIIWGKG
jgi:hypothetical protein